MEVCQARSALKRKAEGQQELSEASCLESSRMLEICAWESEGATAGIGASTEPNRKFVA